MANIPVERTATGTPWWLWLLGLLALAGVVWLVAELFDDEPDVDEIVGVEDNEGVIDDVEIEPFSDDVVTSEDQLFAADDADVVADGGRMDGVTVTRLEPGARVDLDGARVLNVIGDSAFWIGRDDTRRYLVVLAGLGESETGARGTDGVFDINEGDTVSIDGAIARYIDGERGLSELTDDDTEMLRQRSTYIRVNSVGDITVEG